MWWESEFESLYNGLQDWRSPAYRLSMLNALRQNSQAFPLSFSEWSILLRENNIWSSKTGNWDKTVFAVFQGVAREYPSPKLRTVNVTTGKPPIVMEIQTDAVLCSIHSLNNLLQARLANPAMFEHMENAFTESGELQQCDSEHVIRVARTLGVSLVGVTLVSFGISHDNAIDDIHKLRHNHMLEKFLQSTGGFIALRQGIISATSPVGSGHYVAVLYGGKLYNGNWILINSLSGIRLYQTAYLALLDFQKGVPGNISIYFPTIPHISEDGLVDHERNELADAHFRTLRFQLLNKTDITVDAWTSLLVKRHGISTVQLNSAYTYHQFRALQTFNSLFQQSPEDFRTTADVEDTRISWWSDYGDAVTAVLGASTLFNFRLFMWVLLIAHASTAASKAAFQKVAKKMNVDLDVIYKQLYGISSELFQSLNTNGDLSLMEQPYDKEQLKRALTVSLTPEISQLKLNIDSSSVINEMIRILSNNTASASYKTFIVSLGNSLSILVPRWMVERQQRVYGFETDLFTTDVHVDIESSDSVIDVSSDVTEFYIEKSKTDTELRAAIKLLIIELLNKKKSLITKTAEANALIRTGIDTGLLDLSAVPTATSFWKLKGVAPSKLDTFPV